MQLDQECLESVLPWWVLRESRIRILLCLWQIARKMWSIIYIIVGKWGGWLPRTNKVTNNAPNSWFLGSQAWNIPKPIVNWMVSL